jgi:hypothetical protein
MFDDIGLVADLLDNEISQLEDCLKVHNGRDF